VSKIRVLIVDDSALMRQLLTKLLSADHDLEVVGAAADPIRAWEQIQRLRPDVLTLDVEMPKMDGLEFLSKLMRAHPMPVIMCSSLTERGCETTLKALELGAIDFVSKPKLDVQRQIECLSAEIVTKVKAAARARPRARAACAAPAPQRPLNSAKAIAPGASGLFSPVVPRDPRSSGRLPVAPRTSEVAAPVGADYRAPMRRMTDVVLAIGASTGGTEALLEVLRGLPADSPGVVVVQHMPEMFTRHFAERLDRLCAVRVKEAAEGDRILPGHVLIAPGGTQHMEVYRSGAQSYVRLAARAPVNHHRPSVDVLFSSCAQALGSNVVGAILTGMGADGAAGLLTMRNAGARTIAQDEATCVVFGMPKEAIARGAAEFVVPLSNIAQSLLRLSTSRRSSNAPPAA
jgi:two-component system chemotaxis response regulator CheB